MVIGWPLNLTSCGYSKFMKSFVPSMSWQTLYMWQTKVFLKYVVGWDWLLVYPISLNVGLRNL